MAELNARHRFHRFLVEASLRESKWRENNNIAFNYYDGEQWTEDEEATIEERGQQATVLNMIRPIIDLVLSVEVEKRIDLQVIPQEKSDEEKAKLLTILLKHVSDQSDADFYMSQSFRDGLIGGRGWTYVNVYSDDTDKNQIELNWVPWEEVYIDPHHRKPDGSDARYMIRVVWMDRDEVKERWPEKAEEIDNCFYADDYKGTEYEAQTSMGERQIEYYDGKTQRIKLCHCWYKDAKKNIRYCLFSDEVFLIGSKDGENPEPYGINMYPLIPFYSFRTHKGDPKGLVDFLTDAQDQINKLNSKFLWNLSANRLMAESSAADDLEEVREQWNRPDGMAVLNDGGLGKIKSEDNLRECSFLANHMQFLYMMMQRTSGTNDSMTGLGGTNERSAQQQANRILQGASIQTRILENLHFSKKRIAKVVLRLMGKYYTDERVVRITKPNGESDYYNLNQPDDFNEETGEITYLNQIGDTLKYDVKLKAVPPFTAIRERTMMLFSEITKTGAFPPQIAGKIMLMLSDIPEKQELIAELEQFMTAQPPVAQ